MDLCNTAEELRDIFNRRIAPLISRGLILHERSNKPTRGENAPDGATRTVMFDVLDRGGFLVAVCHAYTSDRGELLTRPDPKSALIERIVYFLRPPDRPYPGLLLQRVR